MDNFFSPVWVGAFASLALVFSILATLIFAIQTRKLIQIISSGAKDFSRKNNYRKRIFSTIKEIVGHTKMLRFTVSGIAHWFVMIGFVGLLGTLITAYGQLFSPGFVLPVVGHFVPY